MSDFGGMEDLLQDFLQEAHDLLSDVDNKLVELEKMPDDRGLLNDIFRGFHTVKGGAGFLNATSASFAAPATSPVVSTPCSAAITAGSAGCG